MITAVMTWLTAFFTAVSSFLKNLTETRLIELGELRTKQEQANAAAEDRRVAKKIDAAPTPDRSVILNSLRDPKSGKQ